MADQRVRTALRQTDERPQRGSPRPTPTSARPSAVSERLSRAWLTHPLVQFAHQRRLIVFYQQLHTLLRAGVALPTAFSQLTEYAPDATMAKGLAAVAREVRNGQTLGASLQQHGALFDDANVELLAFAEEAGKLDPVLESIVGHLELVQKQRGPAALGAIYPLYLLGAFLFVGPLLGVGAGMSSGASMGALYLSGLAQNLLWTGIIGGFVFGFPLLVGALDLVGPWDRFKRSLPLVSAPLRSLSASRFVMALGLANGSGLETVRGLRLAARATASPTILEALPAAEAKLRSGSHLTEAVAMLGLLDKAELGLLSVAETTGTIDEALERLGRELQARSLRATRILVVVVTALVTMVLLAKIVVGLLGSLMGVKSYYQELDNLSK
jgi:type II secretory pathway component PulF